MSRELSTVAAVQFDTEVKHAFQSAGGTLQGTTTVRNGVIGNEYKFRKMGKGEATKRGAPSSDVIPMNVGHGTIPCYLGNWEAPEYTDIFDKKEVNFDEVSELGQTIGNALRRREDQLKIDALAGGTFSATPVLDTSGLLVESAVGSNGATGMNLQKLLSIQEFMDNNEVPSEGRYIALTPKGLSGLLELTQVSSSDYNTVKALVNGEIDTFLGFKFLKIGKRSEGGLPASGGTQFGFAWHQSAVGTAIGMETTTRVDYVPQKRSWLSIGMLRMGSVIRDINGICKIEYV